MLIIGSERKDQYHEKLSFFRQFNTYEKIDHPHFCAFDARLDAGVLLKRTRDDHNHNTSNYGHDSAATAHTKNLSRRTASGPAGLLSRLL
jgi:hypothetical protein